MIDQQDLHAFVDGELSPEQAAAIKSSLEASPEDAREVEAIRSLKSLVGKKATPPVGNHAWNACVRRLDELDKTRRAERIVGKYAPALCAGLFVVIVVAGQFGHHSDRGITSPDLARMVGPLSPVNPPKPLGFNKEAWLEGQIRDSMRSTPKYLTVRGESSGELAGVPMRAFMARDPKGDLMIYVVRQPIALDGMTPMADHANLRVGLLDGVNCVVRTEGKTTIFIAADRTFEDLAAVAVQVAIRQP